MYVLPQQTGSIVTLFLRIFSSLMPSSIQANLKVKPNSEEKSGKSEGDEQKSKKEQKEADLVERIALDLDQLDLDETVEKVKAELNDDNR